MSRHPRQGPTPPTDPRQVAQICNRGINRLNAGDARGAVPDLHHAATHASDPKARCTALRGLGTAYARLHVHERAIEAFRQAESIDRTDPLIPMYLALSLRTLERVSEAADACKRVLKLDPEHTGAIALMVDCLARSRRDEEAWRVIEQADRLGMSDPNVDETYATLALRAGRQGEALERLGRHETGAGLDHRDHARVFFSKGDLLDSLGRYEEAWDAYARANELKREEFDTDEWVTSIAALCDVWTPEQIARLQQGASDDDRAVLVVGMPRSGTTLVDLTLGRHPQVHMGGEMTVLGDVFKLISARIGVSPELQLDRMTPDHVREASEHYSKVMDHVGLGSRRVTNKMPMNVPALGLFAALFPNGRIIHTRRDPRDVCLSCYFRNFRYSAPFTSRPEWLAGYYQGYAMLVRHWGKVFRELERAPAMHEVVYEEMVGDHENHARGLIGFLGLDWDEKCLDVAGAGRDTATLRADQVGKSVYKTSAMRHARYADHVGAWEHLEAPSLFEG